MSKQQMYCQCELRKEVPNGTVRHVAWIPAEKVKIGNFITISEEGFTGVWKIISAGSPRPQEIVETFAHEGRKGLPSVSGHERHKRDGKE